MTFPFPGFIPGGNSAAPLQITYRGNYTSAADLSSYTTTALPIGVADATRFALIGIAVNDTAANSISTVSIGGVSATKITASLATNTFRLIEWWWAPIPTGSADVTITVTLTATALDFFLALFTMIGSATATVYDTATSIVDPAALNLDIPNNGAAVAAGWSNLSGTATWTGLTEAFETTLFSGASASSMVAETNRTISDNYSNPANTVAASVSFAP